MKASVQTIGSLLLVLFILGAVGCLKSETERMTTKTDDRQTFPDNPISNGGSQSNPGALATPSPANVIISEELDNALEEMLVAGSENEPVGDPTEPTSSDALAEDLEDDDDLLSLVDEMNEDIEFNPPTAFEVNGSSVSDFKMIRARFAVNRLADRFEDNDGVIGRNFKGALRIVKKELYPCSIEPCRVKYLEYAIGAVAKIGAAIALRSDFSYSSDRDENNGDLNDTTAYSGNENSGTPSWITITTVSKLAIAKRNFSETTEINYFEDGNIDVSFRYLSSGSGLAGNSRHVEVERVFEQGAGQSSEVPPAMRDGSGSIKRTVKRLGKELKAMTISYTRTDGVSRGTIEGNDRRGRTVTGSLEIDDLNNPCPYDNRGQIEFVIHYTKKSVDDLALDGSVSNDEVSADLADFTFAGLRSEETVVVGVGGLQTSVHGTLTLTDGTIRHKNFENKVIEPTGCENYKSSREASMSGQTTSATTSLLSGTRYDGAELDLTIESWRRLHHVYGSVLKQDKEKEVDFYTLKGLRLQR